MNILVIEDGIPMARAFESLLKAAGHQVTCFIGARSLEPLVLIAQDGSDHFVDLSQFQLAYCDGQLVGKIEGPSIVAVLAKASVACVGISTMPNYNNDMVAAGALIAHNKAIAMMALMAGFAPPEEIVANVEAVKARQAQIDAAANDPAIRTRANDLLMSFLD